MKLSLFDLVLSFSNKFPPFTAYNKVLCVIKYKPRKQLDKDVASNTLIIYNERRYYMLKIILRFILLVIELIVVTALMHILGFLNSLILICISAPKKIKSLFKGP